MQPYLCAKLNLLFEMSKKFQPFSLFSVFPPDMMERWWARQFALVALATIYLGPSQGKNTEFLCDTLINNVVADPRTGRLYVGAVNSLYQLNPDLEVESRTETGPKRDNRQCTPPVTDACEEAVDTDNHNKLLLVHGAKDVLVVCGSVFRGICSLRNLSSVEQLLYFSDTKGEKSYVASAEESVSVVGVMSYFSKDRDNFTVFLVRRKTLAQTHKLTVYSCILYYFTEVNKNRNRNDRLHL